MWEDPMNKDGGRWVLNLDKRNRFNELSNTWLETVCCCLLLDVGSFFLLSVTTWQVI